MNKCIAVFFMYVFCLTFPILNYRPHSSGEGHTQTQCDRTQETIENKKTWLKWVGYHYKIIQGRNNHMSRQKVLRAYFMIRSFCLEMIIQDSTANRSYLFYD